MTQIYTVTAQLQAMEHKLLLADDHMQETILVTASLS